MTAANTLSVLYDISLNIYLRNGIAIYMDMVI